MPPQLLLAPFLLISLLLLGLLVARRRRGVEPDTSAARESEEVRLLRLQVQTLTEALQAGGASATPAVPPTRPSALVPATSSVPAPAPPLVMVAEPEAPRTPTLTSWDDASAWTAMADLAPAEPTRDPAEPDLPELPDLAAEPEAPGPVDHTAHDYADLSRELVDADRLREAALAQWAADLRVLGPLLADRGEELSRAVAAIDPADVASVLGAARAAASGLAGPSAAVTAMLTDATHLAPEPARPHHAGASRPTRAPDVPADVLGDDVVRALETVLVGAARDGDDPAEVSVGLRCDLVAHITAHGVPRHSSRGVVDAVRDVLEAHERPRFDAALASVRASVRAS